MPTLIFNQNARTLGLVVTKFMELCLSFHLLYKADDNIEPVTDIGGNYDIKLQIFQGDLHGIRKEVIGLYTRQGMGI